MSFLSEALTYSQHGPFVNNSGQPSLFYLLEIAITTQTPPHVLWEYKLDCLVHEFIVGKLIFMAINVLYIRRKIHHKAISLFLLYMS